ncbi:MAG: GxxExxY protein [Verrucomicrobiales bacterium]|nr:GxxExxY protein [Verrucomicrobiales bacterium]
MDIVYKLESYDLMGACFEVYREQGCGFVEPVYQECLEMELTDRNIPFQAQVPLALAYKGRPLKSKFIPDFICYDKIIVELKAVSGLTDEHRAQVQNYLRATGLKLGPLVNFAHYPKLQHERIVL